MKREKKNTLIRKKRNLNIKFLKYMQLLRLNPRARGKHPAIQVLWATARYQAYLPSG